MLHPKLHDALEEIDAALFNGDAFNEQEARELLVSYFVRWQAKLAEPHDDDDDNAADDDQ